MNYFHLLKFCFVFEQLRRNEQEFCSLHLSRVFIPPSLFLPIDIDGQMGGGDIEKNGTQYGTAVISLYTN